MSDFVITADQLTEAGALAADKLEAALDENTGEFDVSADILEQYGIDGTGFIKNMHAAGMPMPLLAAVLSGIIILAEAQAAVRQTMQDMEDQFNG